MISHKQIVKNTFFLYLRMLVSMGISLYTVRVVLDVLGVQNYGIFHVVGGLVALLSFLPSSMASATQRFFSHALGKGDGTELERIFVVNSCIYAGIGLIALIAFETLGLWFVENQLNIPEDRRAAALIVYHLSVFSFLIGIITTPLNAIMIAHEDMKYFAFISIGESVLRLLLVLLLYFIPGEKLTLYGVMMLLLSIANASIYLSVCLTKYPECRIRRFQWDSGLAQEIVGFTSWTLFGQLTTVARLQAVTILLNQTFGPVVAAARVIAFSIATKANMLSESFNTGLYPPIIKTYAAKEFKEMHTLIFKGAKITFFLMWILALPLLVEMKGILNFWLTEVPPEAVLFARLALVEQLIASVSIPLATAARAPGKMALYESTLGSIQLGILAVAWFVLSLGYSAYVVYVVAILANLLMFVIRLVIVRRLIAISISSFCSSVVLPVMLVSLVSGVLATAVHLVRSTSLLSLFFSVCGSVLLALLAIYYLGLDRNMRARVHVILHNRLHLLRISYSR